MTFEYPPSSLRIAQNMGSDVEVQPRIASLVTRRATAMWITVPEAAAIEGLSG
jgi:hypothetical protein